MTKKLTISVPDDVATRLAREDNVSAYVTEAIRRRMRSENVREVLNSVGFHITDKDMAAARVERERLEASITPELREEARKLRDMIVGTRAARRQRYA